MMDDLVLSFRARRSPVSWNSFYSFYHQRRSSEIWTTRYRNPVLIAWGGSDFAIFVSAVVLSTHVQITCKISNLTLLWLHINSVSSLQPTRYSRPKTSHRAPRIGGCCSALGINGWKRASSLWQVLLTHLDIFFRHETWSKLHANPSPWSLCQLCTWSGWPLSRKRW